jgi:hypothetical protein
LISRLAKLDPLAGPRVPPFEALLHVKVSGGVPVQSDLLSLHAHARAADTAN